MRTAGTNCYDDGKSSPIKSSDKNHSRLAALIIFIIIMIYPILIYPIIIYYGTNE